MYEIVEIVAKHYEVRVIDLCGYSQKPPLPEARKVACSLLLGVYTVPEIANFINRERTYVYRMVADVRFYLKMYLKFKTQYMALEKQVNRAILLKKKKELESFLTTNYNADAVVISEKQKELEIINHQINKK